MFIQLSKNLVRRLPRHLDDCRSCSVVGKQVRTLRQGRGPAKCRSCSFSDSRLVLHPLNQQYCAAESHPDQKSVNLSSQQQTQLGKVAVYPDSKILITGGWRKSMMRSFPSERGVLRSGDFTMIVSTSQNTISSDMLA